MILNVENKFFMVEKDIKWSFNLQRIVCYLILQIQYINSTWSKGQP